MITQTGLSRTCRKNHASPSSEGHEDNDSNTLFTAMPAESSVTSDYQSHFAEHTRLLIQSLIGPSCRNLAKCKSVTHLSLPEHSCLLELQNLGASKMSHIKIDLIEALRFDLPNHGPRRKLPKGHQEEEALRRGMLHAGA